MQEIVTLPATSGRGGQPSTVHAIHLRAPLMTLDAFDVPSDARWVIDRWCESPLPGLMIISGPAPGRAFEQAAVALYDHARAVARSGAHRVHLAPNPEHGDAALLDALLDRVRRGREKVVVPIPALSAEASLYRKFDGERKLPSEVLFGPNVFTAVLHVKTLPALCPVCASVNPEAHAGDGIGARLASDFVSRLGIHERKGVRYIGGGCTSCQQVGTSGIATLIEAHGVIEQSIFPTGDENGGARWMEDLPGNMRGIARSTMQGQLEDHVSAGRVDPHEAIRFL